MILLRIGYHSPVRFNHAAAESTFTVVCRRHRAAPAGCLSPAAACLPYLLPCRGMLETPPPPPELDVSCTEHERHSQRAPLRMHSPETRGCYTRSVLLERGSKRSHRRREGARERYTHTHIHTNRSYTDRSTQSDYCFDLKHWTGSDSQVSLRPAGLSARLACGVSARGLERRRPATTFYCSSGPSGFCFSSHHCTTAATLKIVNAASFSERPTPSKSAAVSIRDEWRRPFNSSARAGG